MYNTYSLWQEVEEMIRKGAVMGIIFNQGGETSHRQAWTHRRSLMTRRPACLAVRKVFADAAHECVRQLGVGVHESTVYWSALNSRVPLLLLKRTSDRVSELLPWGLFAPVCCNSWGGGSQ